MQRKTSWIAAIYLALSCAAPKPREVVPEPGALVVRFQLGIKELGAGRELEVSRGGAVVASGKSDSCGSVVIDPIPVGLYTVTARGGGKVKTIEQVNVQAGEDTDLRVDLREPASLAAAAQGESSPCTYPEIVAGPNPQPTADAIIHHVQGCLVLTCKIGADGLVKSCKAIEPLDRMTEPVIATMKKRFYKPSFCNGVPTEVDDYLVRLSLRMHY